MIMTDAAALSFQDIKVGAVYEFEHKIRKEEVLSFAKLSGDYSPMHVDELYAKKSRFGKNIVHGMLAASFFSTLVGMYCPGKKSLYLSQTVQFKLPIYYDDDLIVKGKVTEKNETTRIITLKTEIIKEGKIAINGEAKVKVMGEENEQ